MNTYQALIILKNSVAEDALDGIVEAARGEIVKLQGVPQEANRLGKQAFVRPMQKMTSGHYIKVRFQMDPANLAPLLTRLKLIDAIFRVQVVSLNKQEVAGPVQSPAPAKGDEGGRSPDAQP